MGPRSGRSNTLRLPVDGAVFRGPVVLALIFGFVLFLMALSQVALDFRVHRPAVPDLARGYRIARRNGVKPMYVSLGDLTWFIGLGVGTVTTGLGALVAIALAQRRRNGI